jgi:uncharacterized protein (DUF488 family)
MVGSIALRRRIIARSPRVMPRRKRCHRRIIADYLLCRGEAVLHIMDTRHITTAIMTRGAQPQADNTLIYPAQTEP